jgi:DNA modification methylase
MIIRADARLLPLRDACVQCCVTSPPYWGLRDYGNSNQIGLEPTPEAYVASIMTVFAEVWRVLRNDGTCWLNLGDSYGSKGNRNGLNGSTLAGKTYGRGCDATNPEREQSTGLTSKQLVGVPWRVAFALQATGWYLRSDIIWAKTNPMPESVTDRPTKSHEYLFLLTKSSTYYYDTAAIAEKSNQGTRNKRSVWTINSQPYSGAHFATMPEALIEPCILAGSRIGDLVFDPFLGSGTVGLVAENNGRRWVGTDLTYQKLSKNRTAQRSLLSAFPEAFE